MIIKPFDFLNIEQIDALPTSPGVYALATKEGIVYIGKAANLRKRVKSHFITPTHKDNFFIKKVEKLGYFNTSSEIESLILEANLIKKYKPKYNTLWKDDKNYFYIIITDERLPRVIVSHKAISAIRIKKYLGPFIDGTALKKTLQMLRNIFPYYTIKNHPKKLCQWCHLKLCPGPNPDKKKYKRSIKRLIGVLEGKTKYILDSLKKEMIAAAKELKFEKAAEIKNNILSLEKVVMNAKIISSEKNRLERWNDLQKDIRNIFSINHQIDRIESYDISNIQGKFSVGVMVVFSKGKKNKKEYRRFKIKYKNTPYDIGMIKEIIARRLIHKEWKSPDLILIDGGKTHLSKIKQLLRKKGAKTKVIAVAKNKRHKAAKLYFGNNKKPTYLSSLSSLLRNFILDINEETHRFALSYHHKLRDIDLKKTLW